MQVVYTEFTSTSKVTHIDTSFRVTKHKQVKKEREDTSMQGKSEGAMETLDDEVSNDRDVHESVSKLRALRRPMTL
jgi:hypothetical protein